MCGMTVNDAREALEEFIFSRGRFSVYIKTDKSYIPIDRIELKDDQVTIIPASEIRERPAEDPEGIESI